MNAKPSLEELERRDAPGQVGPLPYVTVTLPPPGPGAPPASPIAILGHQPQHYGPTAK